MSLEKYEEKTFSEFYIMADGLTLIKNINLTSDYTRFIHMLRRKREGYMIERSHCIIMFINKWG